jgi:hypothetical protein
MGLGSEFPVWLMHLCKWGEWYITTPQEPQVLHSGPFQGEGKRYLQMSFHVPVNFNPSKYPLS